MPDLNNLDLEKYQGIAVEYGISIVLALLIFYVGRMVVNRVVSVIGKLMDHRGTDATLTTFVCSILRWVGVLFVVIASLSQLGIDTTSLIALLGAAGLAIGLSLQGSLGNFAAGVMLIVFKPFQKGHFVEVAGTTGSVDSISIFTTVLTTPDNKEVIVPNGAIIASNITNFSARPTRRIDMVFGISYDDDIRQAKKILQDIIAADDRILSEPAPVISVGELADSSVNFLVRPWVNAADYWKVLWDTTETVKLRFDENGISIPYPQMDVHMQRPASPEADAA